MTFFLLTILLKNCASELGHSCNLSHSSILQTTYLVRLNGARLIKGMVRGFDPFMNLVLDEASDSNEQLGMIVIRGNAIMAIEALDRI